MIDPIIRAWFAICCLSVYEHLPFVYLPLLRNGHGRLPFRPSVEVDTT